MGTDTYSSPYLSLWSAKWAIIYVLFTSKLFIKACPTIIYCFMAGYLSKTVPGLLILFSHFYRVIVELIAKTM